MRKPLIFLAAVWLLAGSHLAAQSNAPAESAKIRVACVGASITFGANIPNRERDCYPAQMQRLLGSGYEVHNFGVNSRTMLKKGDFPYSEDKAYRDALALNPNVVVLDLAGNDSKPQNWKYKDEFAADAKAMIESFRALPSKPRVIMCLPMPAFMVMWGINDEIYTKELIPMMRQVAFETHTELVDLHSAFLGKEAWFGDNVHPNADGAGLMAKIIGGIISFKPDAQFDLEKSLAANGITDLTRTNFYGYQQLDFTMPGGRRCTVVEPYVTAVTHPYAWRGEFFGHEPQTDIALLQRGFHIVYVNAQDMYGSPPAMAIWEQLHTLLAKAGLDGKITLIGMSRGGLYCYNWAALHPETVSVLYGDAPVCDFKSWPGGNLRTTTSKKEWGDLMKLYGFKDEAEAFAYTKNPIDNLAPLAQARIPIIHVVGQADSLVPVQQNTDIIEERYLKLRGTIEVLRKPGGEHHPHSLPNPERIVNFILAHQK